MHLHNYVTEVKVFVAKLYSSLNLIILNDDSNVYIYIHFVTIRPRLGPTFHKVLFAGGLYFVVATVEGCSRQTDVSFTTISKCKLPRSLCILVMKIVCLTYAMSDRTSILPKSVYKLPVAGNCSQ